MNGFTDHSLDESNFSPKGPLSAVQAFDAFPKTKPSYTQKTNNGGVWTIILICASIGLTWSELSRWWVGETTHAFSVEQGVGHDLQINMDIVVAMKCSDLHINVQDASGDRILASSALTKDPTTWRQWSGTHALGKSKEERLDLKGYPGFGEYKEEDVHDYLGAARKSKKFSKTPKLGRGVEPDACRIYGSMEGNKVQGDFHITARGHGYMEFGQHLNHQSFNFSHQINELSFGPFYPSLVNPLDNTGLSTEDHFQKFQYYLSVVPTIYTTDAYSLRKSINKHLESPSSGRDGLSQSKYANSKRHVFTNQYAVTEQSRQVPETSVPGVFVKFDIEPILLTISEEWSGIMGLLVRLVNVVSGLLVAGGWCFQISEWGKEVSGRRGTRRRQSGMGMLDTGGYEGKEKGGML